VRQSGKSALKSRDSRVEAFQIRPKTPEKGAGDLTFLSAMWYNDYDYYNQPVSLTRQGEAG
jgi:hypothetical protein